MPSATATAHGRPPNRAQIIMRLKDELDAGRIAPVRADVSLHADVRIHDLCVSHIMSYHPAWLRFGLEAVYAESLECGDADEKAIASFVKGRLMFDEEIAKAYRCAANTCHPWTHTHTHTAHPTHTAPPPDGGAGRVPVLELPVR